MLTKYAALGAAVAAIAAIAAAAPATTGAFNSSDRAGSQIMRDPTAGNTDHYAFTAPDAPGKLTDVADWIPLQNPAGGPYFGKLDPEARYFEQSIGLGNQGGGQDDVSGFNAHSF